MKDIAEVHLPSKPISMVFNGSVTFMLIDSIASVISDRLDVIEKDMYIKKKVFGVVMECLQNLGKHAVRLKDEEVFVEYDPTSVSFVIETVYNGYQVSTVNFVANDKITELRDWIDTIIRSKPEDIRKKYNDILLNSSFSEKGGSGLGFLDVALRSEGRMEYEFKPFNKDYSLFCFRTEIKNCHDRD